eukprot:TRINITY_DN40252_c0_g1_i1.p1 TRINITY_DN40252_c0_g1~~TRINITY_DN40252_c0_g1_i1.p1  ORF type:complete len:464 (+),score=132.36 TRINITY_DN40252_c0_g1_i1:59-1393(+)
MTVRLGRWQKRSVKAPSESISAAAGAPALRGRAFHTAVALEEEGRRTSSVVVIGGKEQASGAGGEHPCSYLMDVSELGLKGYQPTLLDGPAALGVASAVGPGAGVVCSGRSILIAGGETPDGRPRSSVTRCTISGSKAEWRNLCTPQGGPFGRDERYALTGHAVCRVRAQGADWLYAFGGTAVSPDGATSLSNQVYRRRAGDSREGFELFCTGNMVPSARRDAAILHLPVGTESGSGYLLLWGGRTGPDGPPVDSDVHILSIDERSWFTVDVADDPAMLGVDDASGRPAASYGHTMELVGNSVLLIGGADTVESAGLHLVLNPLTSLWMLRIDEHGALRWLREGEHFRMQKDDDAQIALEGGRHFHATVRVRAQQDADKPEQDCIVLVGGVNQSADVTGQGHVMLMWLNGDADAVLPDPDLKRIKQSVFCAGLNHTGLCQCNLM